MKEKLNSVSKSSGKTKKDVRVEVREIKNGFIIRKSTEWTDSKNGWQRSTEEWFSETDPLDIKIDDKSLADIF